MDYLLLPSYCRWSWSQYLVCLRSISSASLAWNSCSLTPLSCPNHFKDCRQWVAVMVKFLVPLGLKVKKSTWRLFGWYPSMHRCSTWWNVSCRTPPLPRTRHVNSTPAARQPPRGTTHSRYMDRDRRSFGIYVACLLLQGSKWYHVKRCLLLGEGCWLMPC